MTITYKNSVIFVPRRLNITERTVREGFLGDVVSFNRLRIEMTPNNSSPLEDTIIITTKGATYEPRVIKGPEINKDPECRRYRMGWYR